MTIRRILSFVALLALVLLPATPGPDLLAAAPTDRHGAIAGQVGSGHPCADHQGPADKKAVEDCCVTACVAIPAGAEDMAARPLPAAIRRPSPAARDPHGLVPEAEPPPPRSSS